MSFTMKNKSFTSFISTCWCILEKKSVGYSELIYNIKKKFNTIFLQDFQFICDFELLGSENDIAHYSMWNFLVNFFSSNFRFYVALGFMIFSMKHFLFHLLKKCFIGQWNSNKKSEKVLLRPPTNFTD